MTGLTYDAAKVLAAPWVAGFLPYLAFLFGFLFLTILIDWAVGEVCSIIETNSTRASEPQPVAQYTQPQPGGEADKQADPDENSGSNEAA
jgi:hypothetical protein